MNNRMTRRTMLKLAGAFGATAALAACAPAAPGAGSEDSGAASTEGAEVVMMYQANEISDAEIEQFNTDYAPIVLTRVDVDTTRYNAMFASGEAPDLLRVQAPSIPQMLARGMLLNLQPYFDNSDVLRVDDLVPVNNYYRAGDAMNIGEGDLYGMVKDWAPDTFTWVNETVFEEAGVPVPDFSKPLSAEEVVDAAQQITTTEGDQVLTMGFDTVIGFIDRFWMTMTESGGGSLYEEDFSAINIVGNEAAEAAIRFFYDFAASGAMTSPQAPSPAWFGPDFAAGRLGILWTGYWFHGFAVADPTEEFQQAIEDGKIKMHPTFTWAGERSNPCVTATGAIVSGDTKVPDESWIVFEWFMGKEPAENRAVSGWGLPGLESLYDLIPKENALSAQSWETIQEELPYAEKVLLFNPFLAGGEPMVPGQVYMTNLEQALNGDITIEEVMARIESETNIAIQEGMDRIG